MAVPLTENQRDGIITALRRGDPSRKIEKDYNVCSRTLYAWNRRIENNKCICGDPIHLGRCESSNRATLEMGQKILKARKEENLSTAEILKRFNISRSSAGRILKGHPITRAERPINEPVLEAAADSNDEPVLQLPATPATPAESAFRRQIIKRKPRLPPTQAARMEEERLMQEFLETRGVTKAPSVGDPALEELCELVKDRYTKLYTRRADATPVAKRSRFGDRMPPQPFPQQQQQPPQTDI